MTGLGDLEGGAFSSLAFSVSADGSVVVGASSSSLSGLEYEAFRWEDGVMVGLGDLEGGQHPIWFNSEAWDVSSDGSVVVGVGTSYSGDEAFIWDSTDGMRNLKYVLMYDKFSRSSLGDKLRFGPFDNLMAGGMTFAIGVSRRSNRLPLKIQSVLSGPSQIL